jgi:hypothetical protein
MPILEKHMPILHIMKIQIPILQIHVPILQIMKTVMFQNVLGTGHCASLEICSSQAPHQAQFGCAGPHTKELAN